MRLNWPPNWPQPPQGWTPPPGWQPDPSWGPAPPGWQFWVEDAPQPTQQFRPDQALPSFQQQPRSRPRGLIIAGVVAGIVLIAGLVTAIVWLTRDTPQASPTPSVESTDPAAVPTTTAPQPSATTPSTEPTASATDGGDTGTVGAEIGEVVTGVGDAVVHVNGAIDAYLVVNGEYSGSSGGFRVGYQDGTAIYSSSGPISFTTLFNATTDVENEETVVVSASGPWTLSFTDLWEQPEYDTALGASGDSTTVLLTSTLTGDAPITFDSQAEMAPSLYAISQTGGQPIAGQDAGPLSQATTIPQDTVVLVVLSDGQWSMTPN